MARERAIGDVEDHFGHIGGVVANSLEAARDIREAKHRAQLQRITRGEPQEALHRLALELVEAGVLLDHAMRERRVVSRQRVKTVGHQGTSPHRHSTEYPLRGAGVRMRVGNAMGNIYRLVADALELGDELQRRDDEAQVNRRRLVQRKELDARFVDLKLQVIDVLIEGDHVPRAGRVGLEKGLRRPA
jgi:hypothetical protein